MSDRAAYLLACCDEPHEDAPRLAFADWLDESGDELGEFIRVQVERERIPQGKDDPRPSRTLNLTALVRREDELLADHWGGWLRGAFEPLGRLQCVGTRDETYRVTVLGRTGVDAGSFTCAFVRGFPDSLTLTPADAFALGIDRLRRLTPVCDIQFTERPTREQIRGVWRTLGLDQESGHDPFRLRWPVEDLLKDLWPKIRFALPPRRVRVRRELPTHQADGLPPEDVVLEAVEEIRVGDRVYAGADGRAVKSRSLRGAGGPFVGRALSAAE